MSDHNRQSNLNDLCEARLRFDTTALHARTIALVAQLDSGLRPIMLFWTMVASLACGIRVATSATTQSFAVQASSLSPYLLVVGAPIASLMLALHWFRGAANMAQPETRLARFGRWQSISAAEARRMPLYGVSGIMASLLLGMLINIPVRAVEFLTAIPALIGTIPPWFGALFLLMLADVVLLSSLYAIAFVAALRHVPLFPRLLAAIWCVDVLMQITIARVMGTMPDLPPEVATALHSLLEGNLKKVLISLALWLPYLLLSKRVNLTFRHRIPA